ncbi:hypothetical protein [Nocardia sp. NPDC057668]|uniref:hypothetical protein n=1 Tax=Nocardia sp. NPDC057668 TaxID=3346202 RepID=UPI00366C5BCF
MTAVSTEITTADAFAAAWTEMWNGAPELVNTLCGGDFRIAFGKDAGDGTHPADELRGPAEFAEFLREYLGSRAGIRFAIDGSAVGTFSAAGPSAFACRWFAELPDGNARSGIDFFETRDGKLTRVWSVTGERRFPF